MSGEEVSFQERIDLPEVPKELAKKFGVLEQKFVRAEVEQLRNNVIRTRPILEELNRAIEESPIKDSFWIRVLSNAPPDIDDYILSADADILGSTLKNLKVDRFEVDANGQGEPRSFRLTFEFHTGAQNQYFENEKLVKDFYWRKQVTTNDKGKKKFWEGLVSEPVRIAWKEGKDPTNGLLDAACDLAEAEKKKGGDRKELAEYGKILEKNAEAADAANNEDEDDEDDFPEDGQSPAGTSFFSFFGYRGRDATAEESEKATKEDDERFAKILNGEKVEDEDEDDDEEHEHDGDGCCDDGDEFDEIEIYPDGEELAVSLAEDLYANSLKYFDQSFRNIPEELLGDDSEEDDSELEGEEQPRKKVKV